LDIIFNKSFFIFSPLIGLIFSLAVVVLGLFVAYLIIRAAIDHSRLNHHMDELKFELSQLNNQVRALKEAIEKDKWQS